MEPTTDIIVDISESRERFFGCSGKMLIPCPATVEAMIQEIPLNTLTTTGLIQKELAKRHEVQVTCPSAIRKAIKAIANTPSKNVPYWRVLKKNGELIPFFPGGLNGHAALLTKEGFTIDNGGKTLKVTNYQHSLVCFGGDSGKTVTTPR